MRLGLLLVPIWLSATPAAGETYGKPECLRQSPECDLTVPTVLAEPDRYSGSFVRVRGYVVGDWEGVMMFGSLADCQDLGATDGGDLGLGHMELPVTHSDFSNWPCWAGVVEGVFFPHEEPPSDGRLVICIRCNDGYLEDIRYLEIEPSKGD